MNIDYYDTYEYSEIWYPKKETIKNYLSRSGCHISRCTREKRYKKKKERNNMKKHYVELHTQDICLF